MADLWLCGYGPRRGSCGPDLEPMLAASDYNSRFPTPLLIGKVDCRMHPVMMPEAMSFKLSLRKTKLNQVLIGNASHVRLFASSILDVGRSGRVWREDLVSG